MGKRWEKTKAIGRRVIGETNLASKTTPKYGGEYLGVVKQNQMPGEIQGHMGAFRRIRKARGFNYGEAISSVSIGVIGAAARLDKLFEAMGQSPWVAISFPILGTAVGSFAAISRSHQIRNHAAAIAAHVEKNPTNHININLLKLKGATHIFLDKEGNVHFVKAPKLSGKLFRPFFGRLRAPINQFKEPPKHGLAKVLAFTKQKLS